MNNPCKLLEKLFDSLVTSILLYCSEVWGIYLDPRDSSIVEKFHMKFIKEILGVHCIASNVACRAELRNKTERSILWKIRISAHILAIERGRHFGLHTSDIICTIFQTGDVEDESHLLFKCEKYSNYRTSFQCNILSILYKNHLSENQMLKFCMNSNSLKKF